MGFKAQASATTCRYLGGWFYPGHSGFHPKKRCRKDTNEKEKKRDFLFCGFTPGTPVSTQRKDVEKTQMKKKRKETFSSVVLPRALRFPPKEKMSKRHK